MSESARKMLANKRIEGKACTWCQTPLALGDASALCTTCDREHHERCWDEHGGCSDGACTNAPLQRLDAPGPGASPGHRTADPGNIFCPQCGKQTPAGAGICTWCQAIVSPDGLYHGPKENAPGAVASVVIGIVGFVFFGFILGAVAISKAKDAKRAIAMDPRYTGEGLATTGMVLGIIDIVGWIIVLAARVG